VIEAAALLLLQDLTKKISIGPLEFNPEIKIGDFLTPISLIITVLTFAWTIRKDIVTRQGTEADKVRAAAAKALGKLQRWRELALWYYRDIQSVFVATSNLLAKEFDVDSARDHLWTVLPEARVKNSERILNEALETAYVELASYYPGVYDAFRATVATMKKIEEERFADFLQLCQNAVLSLRDRQQDYVPPILGNALRSVTGAVTGVLSDQLNTASAPIEQFLVSVIKQNDHALLERKSSVIDVPGPSTQRFPGVVEAVGAAKKAAR
jgi:hypothetical protein